MNKDNKNTKNDNTDKKLHISDISYIDTLGNKELNRRKENIKWLEKNNLDI